MIIEGYNNDIIDLWLKKGITMKKMERLGLPANTFFKRLPKRVRLYWGKVMNSTHKRMSRGGLNISRIITWARNENWRRKEKKK